MMWYWGGGVHWWGWLLGALAMVAFWGVLIWAVWYFVTAVTRRPEGHRPQGDRPEGDRPGAADPKGFLDERLARGDIDADESWAGVCHPVRATPGVRETPEIVRDTRLSEGLTRPRTARRPWSSQGPRALRDEYLGEWWRGQDLNLRPSGYEPDELPNCSTPRWDTNTSSR